MKTLATIGDNCVDIYPQLNKAFSGGNAVNVAVYCTRYGIKPGCITWVGDDDYGTKLKQDLARMDVDISHVHTKHGVTAQTQVELHDQRSRFWRLHRRRDGRLCPERRGLRLAGAI